MVLRAALRVCGAALLLAGVYSGAPAAAAAALLAASWLRGLLGGAWEIAAADRGGGSRPAALLARLVRTAGAALLLAPLGLLLAVVDADSLGLPPPEGGAPVRRRTLLGVTVVVSLTAEACAGTWERGGSRGSAALYATLVALCVADAAAAASGCGRTPGAGRESTWGELILSAVSRSSDLGDGAAEEAGGGGAADDPLPLSRVEEGVELQRKGRRSEEHREETGSGAAGAMARGATAAAGLVAKRATADAKGGDGLLPAPPPDSSLSQPVAPPPPYLLQRRTDGGSLEESWRSSETLPSRGSAALSASRLMPLRRVTLADSLAELSVVLASSPPTAARRTGRCALLLGRLVAVTAAAAAFVALLLWAAAHDPLAADWAERHARLRGVNFGGWLVAERWLVGPPTVPGVFEPSSSWAQDDEHDASLARRGSGTTEAVSAFRDVFITRADFAAAAALGLNSVRIPFGWWIAAPTDAAAEPYVRGRGLGYLDDAVLWAEEEGLTVVLDLHGAPGSQNGEQTSGLEYPDWDPSHFDADAAVWTVETVAARFSNRSCIVAFELLNEPRLGTTALLEYYRRGSEAVRRHMPPERVAVVINLYFFQHMATQAWASFDWRMPARRHPNLVYDLHTYTCFLERGRGNDASLPLWLYTGPLVELYAALLSITVRPAFAGEWSLCLPWYGAAAATFRAMNPPEQRALRTGFASRQADALTRGDRLGGHFWTWKAPHEDDKDSWDFAEIVRRGFIGRGEWAV